MLCKIRDNWLADLPEPKPVDNGPSLIMRLVPPHELDFYVNQDQEEGNDFQMP